MQKGSGVHRGKEPHFRPAYDGGILPGGALGSAEGHYCAAATAARADEAHHLGAAVGTGPWKQGGG